MKTIEYFFPIFTLKDNGIPIPGAKELIKTIFEKTLAGNKNKDIFKEIKSPYVECSLPVIKKLRDYGMLPKHKLVEKIVEENFKYCLFSKKSETGRDWLMLCAKGTE